MTQKTDYIVRATAAGGQIRAFAATTRGLVEEARGRHGTSPGATAALGRLLTAGVMRGYLRMTRFDWMILLVCIALTLTAVHYTLYQFMKDMLYIAEERSKAHEKTDEI